MSIRGVVFLRISGTSNDYLELSESELHGDVSQLSRCPSEPPTHSPDAGE